MTRECARERMFCPAPNLGHGYVLHERPPPHGPLQHLALEQIRPRGAGKSAGGAYQVDVAFEGHALVL